MIDLGTIDAGLGPRRVRAFVPPKGKARDTTARPLLVMFDGQNVFGDRGSFAGGWHVDASVARFAETRRTAAPIVVAIDHGGSQRIDELAPFRDPRHGGGHLGPLIETIATKLVPHVERRFAIDPVRRFAGGASLGGLASLYAHFMYPEVFAGALALSPSLWFARERVAAALLDRPHPASSRVYLDCGAREGAAMWPAILAFARSLRARGWRDAPAKTDHRLVLRRDARGKHHETAWRRRFPAALRFTLSA